MCTCSRRIVKFVVPTGKLPALTVLIVAVDAGNCALDRQRCCAVGPHERNSSMNEQSSYDERLAKQAAECRRGNSAFSRRAEGYGVIRHSDETQMRVRQLVHSLEGRDASGDAVCVYDLLMALDRVPSVGLWLVVHQIYAGFASRPTPHALRHSGYRCRTDAAAGPTPARNGPNCND